jgi:type III restriction enzyme
VLDIRAFGTRLLCEQVIGRALRRQSYDLNEEGLFNVEYAESSACRLTSPPSL